MGACETTLTTAHAAEEQATVPGSPEPGKPDPHQGLSWLTILDPGLA
jgi:hypothetical protein